MNRRIKVKRIKLQAAEAWARARIAARTARHVMSGVVTPDEIRDGVRLTVHAIELGACRAALRELGASLSIHPRIQRRARLRVVREVTR
jgi:hypothetical protein